MELFLYRPFLDSFGLKADDIEISLNGSLLTQHKGKNVNTLRHIVMVFVYDAHCTCIVFLFIKIIFFRCIFYCVVRSDGAEVIVLVLHAVGVRIPSATDLSR